MYPPISLKENIASIRNYESLHTQKDASNIASQYYLGFREILQLAITPLFGSIKQVSSLANTEEFQVLDAFTLPIGNWVFSDQLSPSTVAYFDKLRSNKNLLVQGKETCILFQNGQETIADLRIGAEIASVVNQFLNFKCPNRAKMEMIVSLYEKLFPKVRRIVKSLLQKERGSNERFKLSYRQFLKQCQVSIDSEIQTPDLDEMIVVDMMLYDLLQRNFTHHLFGDNPISTEIKGLIAQLPKTNDLVQLEEQLEAFNQDINDVFQSIPSQFDKIQFITAFYHHLIRKDCVQEATPFPIELSSLILSFLHDNQIEGKNRTVLLPFFGNGQFALSFLEVLETEKHANCDVFLNERDLMNYYLGSLILDSIANAKQNDFYEKAVNRLCLVNSFELGVPRQVSLFNPENSERILIQETEAIHCILSSIPTAAIPTEGDVNGKDYQNQQAMQEVKNTKRTIKWCLERVEEDGIVGIWCTKELFHGLNYRDTRKWLIANTKEIRFLEVGGTKQNGNGLLLLKKAKRNSKGKPKVFYAKMPKNGIESKTWNKLEHATYNQIDWSNPKLNRAEKWHTSGFRDAFNSLIPLEGEEDGFFKYALHKFDFVPPDWSIGFNKEQLLEESNATLKKIRDEEHIEMASPEIQQRIRNQGFFQIEEQNLVAAQISPFLYAYFASKNSWIPRRYRTLYKNNIDNLYLVVFKGTSTPFRCYCTTQPPLLSLKGVQISIYPFYTYERGVPQLNVNEEVIQKIAPRLETKQQNPIAWFHYLLASLHEPAFLKSFQSDLMGRNPRIPLSKNFNDLVAIGKALAGFYLNFQKLQAYQLTQVIGRGMTLDYDFKMLSLEQNNTMLRVNSSLTFRNVPQLIESFHLGGKSVFELAVSTLNPLLYKLRNSPAHQKNQQRNELFQNLGQIITVSLESQRIVASMPKLDYHLPFVNL